MDSTITNSTVMDADIQLSLRPQDRDPETAPAESWPLAQLIPRIIAERGSFADINEEELLKEIEEDKNKHSVDVEIEVEDVDMDEEESSDIDADVALDQSLETFHTRRAELLDQIRAALNESALSLDFVSLLISCQRPAAGTTSMSPLLKQRVPVGSLGADTVFSVIPEEDPKVSAGWKINSLNNASSQLSSASEYLTSEIEKEKKYWKSVSELAHSGEALFKLRRGDSRALCVKYGFNDSGSEYSRNKGIAAIRRAPDGGVIFKHDTPLTNKAVKVTIYEIVDGEKRKTGWSITNIQPLSECENCSQEISRARRLLMEEELFYEILREQRLLASQKTSISDGKVSISVHDEIIEIEYADILNLEDNDVHLFPACERAEMINQALHLLLCHAYKRNLEKRQKNLPTPIDTKARKIPSPLFILRPLLAHLLHWKILKRTTLCLEMILTDHGLMNSQLNLRVYSSVTEDQQKRSPLGILLFPPISTYDFSCHGLQINITVSSPVQNSEPLYSLTAIRQFAPTCNIKVYELSEVEDWLRWVLSKEVEGK